MAQPKRDAGILTAHRSVSTLTPPVHGPAGAKFVMGRGHYLHTALGLAVVLVQVCGACTGGSHPKPKPSPRSCPHPGAGEESHIPLAGDESRLAPAPEDLGQHVHQLSSPPEWTDVPFGLARGVD